MWTIGSRRAARACKAWARPISPPSTVTAALFDMFCGLNGPTFRPAIGEGAAEAGDDQRLADIGARALEHQGACHRLSLAIDDMGIGTHDPAVSGCPWAADPRPSLSAAAKSGSPRAAAGEAGIVEFVAAQTCAARAGDCGGSGGGSRDAARGSAKEVVHAAAGRPCRGGCPSASIKPSAQNHVATAFAIDQRAARRGVRQAVA